jgi:SPP1 gp7 family putative phage head morphogenesis protein
MKPRRKLITPIPRVYAAGPAVVARRPGLFVVKAAGDIYGAGITSPLARPTGTGAPRPARQFPQGPFPWEKPIPINSRDIEVELRRYMDPAEKRVARVLYSTWNAERDAIKYQELRNAVRDGDLDPAWIARWKRDYANYVNTTLDPEWRNGWVQGGDYTAKNVARALGVSYDFPKVGKRMDNWVSARGAELTVDLYQEQVRAVRNIVRHYAVDQGVGPKVLDKYIRPVIGLTEREAAAVARRRDLLTIAGLSEKEITHRTEQYSGFLLRRRAERIARTETAFAYEYGTFDGIKTAQEQGLFNDYIVIKKYSTSADERTCPFCSELDEQTIGIDETFPGVTDKLPNVLVPPVHPNCRCTVIYEVVPMSQVARNNVKPAKPHPGAPASPPTTDVPPSVDDIPPNVTAPPIPTSTNPTPKPPTPAPKPIPAPPVTITVPPAPPTPGITTTPPEPIPPKPRKPRAPKPAAPPTDVPPSNVVPEKGWFPAESIPEARARLERHIADGGTGYIGPYGKPFPYSPGKSSVTFEKEMSDVRRLEMLNTIDAEITRCRSIGDACPNILQVKSLDNRGAAGMYSPPRLKYKKGKGFVVESPIISTNRRLTGAPLGTGENYAAMLTKRSSIDGTVRDWAALRVYEETKLSTDLIGLTIRHEWGHLYHRHCGYDAADKVGQALTKEWFDFYIKHKKAGTLRNYVSEYARDTEGEAFAEMFTIYSSPKFVPGSIDAVFGQGSENLMSQIIKKGTEIARKQIGVPKA